MRRIVVTLFIILFSSFHLMNAQTIDELKTEIKKIKQEKLILENKIDFCDLYSKSKKTEVKSFHNDFEMKVLKVIGNKNKQTVDVIFTLKHSIPNQKLTLYGEKTVAYDEMGSIYPIKEIDFSGNKSDRYVFQNIPFEQLIQGKLKFRNVLPNIDRFGKVVGEIETKNSDGGDNQSKGKFEFKNLIINWK